MPDGKELSISISFAKNGVTVRANCHYEQEKGMKYMSEEYVYKSLEDALAEIPSIVSVFKQEKKKPVSKQSKVRDEDYDED